MNLGKVMNEKEGPSHTIKRFKVTSQIFERFLMKKKACRAHYRKVLYEVEVTS